MDGNRLLDGRLKIRHLMMLTAIADAGGIVRAAESMHVTQPVVTRALKEVEELLGVELFERHPRGVTPTMFGESFLGTARAVIGQLRASAVQLTALSTAELGSVSVGTHLAGANMLLPRAIASVKEQHPRLTVVVREATPDALQLMVLSGELDMVVGRLPPGLDERLRAQTLCREPVVVATRKDHPALAMPSIQLTDLLNFPWVLPLSQTRLRSEVEQLFVDKSLSLPDSRVECTSMSTMRHLIVSGDVVAVLPRFVVAGDERLAEIDVPEFKRLGHLVGVTAARDVPLTPGAKVLLECLHEEGHRLDPTRPRVTVTAGSALPEP